MPKYTSVLRQLLGYVPRGKFQQIVNRCQGDKRVRCFTCWQQFVALSFGQLTGQQSLRDLESAVRAQLPKLSRAGLRTLSRSTLADANEKRPAEIYRELFGYLYQRCRQIAPRHGFRFEHKLYLLDATLFKFSLKLAAWAKFNKVKGAAKAHMTLDCEGLIPSFCPVTVGKASELELARRQSWEPDSILVFDRAYIDYHWFHQLDQQGVYFVTRLKRNASYRVTQRRAVDKGSGLSSDQTIRITGTRAECLPIPTRRVGYRDRETGIHYVFHTNIFHLSALEIARLYKKRWDIENFFKWIKQHLALRSFLGNSHNAVQTQIWIALCVHLLLSYVRFLTQCRLSLYEVLRRVRATVLEYRSIPSILRLEAPRPKPKQKQLRLWDRRAKPLFSTL